MKKGVFLLIIFSFLFSCKASYLQLLSNQEEQLRTQPRYNNYLALEYLEFSKRLLRVGDKKNSEYFAKKGRESALGIHIEPENPLIWKADSAQMQEMVLTQKRLEDVLNASKIKVQLPIQAAHLTYLYDCWISRESTQVFLGNDLGFCHNRFSKLLSEIENYIDESRKDRSEKVEIIPPEFERFELKFGLGLYKLNKQAQRDLIKFLDYIKALEGNYRILVVGNADRVAGEIFNKSLALKRANVVINYLVKSGINSDIIEIRSVGEDFPDILTRDEFSNPNNRNVSLYVLKGSGTFQGYPLPLLENIVYKKEIEKARKDRGL